MSRIVKHNITVIIIASIITFGLSNCEKQNVADNVYYKNLHQKQNLPLVKTATNEDELKQILINNELQTKKIYTPQISKK